LTGYRASTSVYLLLEPAFTEEFIETRLTAGAVKSTNEMQAFNGPSSGSCDKAQIFLPPFIAEMKREHTGHDDGGEQK